MSKETPSADVRWFICDRDHVHLTFVDEDGSDILSVSMDIKNWVDLADAIDEEIDVMIAVEESVEAVKH